MLIPDPRLAHLAINVQKEIQKQLEKWAQAKLAGDIETAEDIARRLRGKGVEPEERTFGPDGKLIVPETPGSTGSHGAVASGALPHAAADLSGAMGTLGTFGGIMPGGPVSFFQDPASMAAAQAMTVANLQALTAASFSVQTADVTGFGALGAAGLPNFLSMPSLSSPVLDPAAWAQAMFGQSPLQSFAPLVAEASNFSLATATPIAGLVPMATGLAHVAPLPMASISSVAPMAPAPVMPITQVTPEFVSPPTAQLVAP